MNNNQLYSYHIFLFPFQWQFVGEMMKNKTMEERTGLCEFVGMFDSDKWEKRDYRLDNILNYNEYNYFFEMVRGVLFDEGKDPEKSIISNLFYKIEPDTHFYEFNTCISENTYKTYKLHIDSIIMHLYSTGVGVLSFHLNNRLEDQNSKEDILNINQAGRRIYPPFYAMDKNLIGSQSQFSFNDFTYGLQNLKKKELADYFTINGINQFEDFSLYTNPANFESNPFQLPCHFKALFGNIPVTVDKKDFNSKTKMVYVNPLIDDRMFVICWFGDDELCNRLTLRTRKRRECPVQLNYETDEWWYKFIFNDQKESTCQNEEMRAELIRKHTYRRWTGYNTLYGVNKYSFVCLTTNLDKLKEPGINAAFLVNHMQTIYYKMAELCLVQRASILRFSEEVTGISAMKDKNLTDRVSALYKQYIRFVNRIYFREVTAQEQGIELYSMMQEHMRIEQNVKDLDNEISELHQYSVLLEDKERNKSLTILSVLGAAFIVPTFITGFFGMNLFGFNSKDYSITSIWILFCIAVVSCPLLIYFFIRIKNKAFKILIPILVLMILILALLSPILFKLK